MALQLVGATREWKEPRTVGARQPRGEPFAEGADDGLAHWPRACSPGILGQSTGAAQRAAVM